MFVAQKKIWMLLFCILPACSACLQRTAPGVRVSPQHFNISIPFQTDVKGIIIATHWGAAKTEHKLYLDNHSPTWASNAIINGNGSIAKSKDFLYRTTTADGKTIEGDVYICDSIHIGQVNFTGVPFYNISTETNAGKTDGAIGENIMSEGVWLIDFKNQMIHFASSLDSVNGLNEANRLPVVFTNTAIEIQVSFSHPVADKFELDLGYNGGIILPAAAFAPIVAGNKKMYTVPRKFSTPASEDVIDHTIAIDSAHIGACSFAVAVSTNKLVKEKLIGLGFFSQFEFIILDYPGKALYISKKKLYDIPELK